MNLLRIRAVNIGPFVDQEYIMGPEPLIQMVLGINNEEGSKKESNGSGKSMFFVDIPEWVTFGRMRGEWSKELLNDEVLRIVEGDTRVEEGYGEIEFEANDKIFKLKRHIKFEGKQTLSAFMLVDGEWKPLRQSASIDKNSGKRLSAIATVQKAIEEELGCNCELFINSVCFEQGNMNAFARAGIKEREDLLGVAVNKQKWTAYGEKCKDKRKIVVKNIDNLQFYLDENDSDALNTEIEEDKLSIENTEKVMKAHQSTLKDEKAKVEELNMKFMSLIAKKESIDELEEKLGELGREKTSHERMIKSIDQKISGFTSNASNARQFLPTHKETLQESETGLVQAQEHLHGISQEQVMACHEKATESSNAFKDVERDLEKLETQLESTNTVTCPGSERLCTNVDNDAIEEQQKKIKTKIFNVKRKLLKCRKLKEQDSKTYDDLKADFDEDVGTQEIIDDAVRSIDTLQETIREYQEQVDQCDTKISAAEDEKVAYRKLLKKVEDEGEKVEAQYNENHEAVKEIESVETELDEFRESVKKYETAIDDCKDTIRTNKANIESNEKTLKDVKKKKKELLSLDETKNILDFTQKMYSNGIPHALLEQAIPEIEYHAKHFLEQLSNGRMDVDFITQKTLRSKDAEKNQKTKDTFEIVLTLDSKKYSYGLFSGGEKSRADVAIHLAYSMYLLGRSGAKLETLFLDEVCGALDEEGKERLILILNQLMVKGYFKKIFVITQDEKLKRMMDDVIVVMKTNDGSILKH